MAEYNMNNYQASRVDSPVTKIAPGDQGGKLKCAYDEVDLSTLGAALGLNDTLNGPVLPPGARVHEVVLVGPSSGANGSLEVGHGIIYDSKGNVLEAADADAFVVAQDFTGAAALKKSSDNVATAGLLKKYSSEAELPLVINASVAWAAQVGIVKLAVYYTID